MIIFEGFEKVEGSLKTGNVSVDKSTGEIVEETLDYNNVMLYYRTNDRPYDPEKDRGVKGWFCESAKANADNLQIIGAKSLDDLLGKNVLFSIDMTKRPDRMGKLTATILAIVKVGD